METKQLNISEIKPYEKNIKRHSEDQIKQIAGSITEFWYIQPVVVDENNVIVIWHGRFEALKSLWKDKVDVIQLKWVSPEKIRALRIADNKMNESPYDFSNLQSELKELFKFDIDLTDLWFTEFELSNFWISLAPIEEIKVDSYFDNKEEYWEKEQVKPAFELPSEIMWNQNSKKPITFFCTPEEYDILYPIFATSRKWEANTQLLLEYINK